MRIALILVTVLMLSFGSTAQAQDDTLITPRAIKSMYMVMVQAKLCLPDKVTEKDLDRFEEWLQRVAVTSPGMTVEKTQELRDLIVPMQHLHDKDPEAFCQNAEEALDAARLVINMK